MLKQDLTTRLHCFQVVNQHLLKDLTEQGLWDDDMKNQIIAAGGSIQVNSSPHTIRLDCRAMALILPVEFSNTFL